MPVDIGVMMLVHVRALKGFVAQPPSHICALGDRIVKPDVEKENRIDGTLCDPNDQNARVQRLQPRFDHLPHRELGKIALGQQ